MILDKEIPMGRFSVEIELSNHEDLILAENGHIRPEQVRRARISGVVDTGAARLVIPAFVAQQLGVETSGNAKVRYADGHTAERAIAKNVHLAYGGRDSVFSAVVEPDRSEEHTSELQSLAYLVCRLLLEKKKIEQHHKSSSRPTATRSSTNYRACQY